MWPQQACVLLHTCLAVLHGWACLLWKITECVQLVLINISDHSIRSRVTTGAALPRVIGCLLGKHAGRQINIMNTFEMIEAPDTAACFDHALFDQMRDQYREVFKDLDVLGLYITGSGLLPQDRALQGQLAEQVEAPILLSLDTTETLEPTVSELPIQLYESGACSGWQETTSASACHTGEPSEVCGLL